jgi:nucleoside 2-deoxyribosyltransferase
MVMKKCFVMQPFDGGPFDKRYEDTLAPAIQAAGIEPYRVDRDAAAVIPIESIERGIHESDVCLADISTDNPNVWLEVGFALASGKGIILVCSQERQRFPFDVQHRTIIRYKTESRVDFERLAEEVTRRLCVAIKTSEELKTIEQISPIANAEGLSAHEMVALVVIGQSLDGPVSASVVSSSMNRAGYTDIAVSLALRSLTKRAYVDRNTGEDFNGNQYLVYTATEAGFRWLETNRSKLVMQREPQQPSILADDAAEIPF